MNLVKTYIPFEATAYFSRIVIDYLHGDEKLENLVQAFPSQAAIGKQISIKASSYNTGNDKRPQRELLQQVLLQQYSGIEMAAEVRKNIDSLPDEKTFTVCTAHQPCIFTGPLYFIYKITHAIQLAKECSALFPGYHFVPVFYMGSEDNDIDEIGTLFLGDQALKWETAQRGACGRMNTTDLEPITQQVLSLLNDNEADEKWLSQLIREAYMGGRSLAQATRILVNGLFEHSGLLVLDGDDRQLKQVFVPVMEDELFHRRSSRLVHETGSEIAGNYKVQAAGRDINLFYLNAGLRERIEMKESQWVVHNTDISFSAEELREELQQHPERFSPNVILRPLYQEMLLPNIAFIGGGGELAYWLELKRVFDHYQVSYPLIFLRNSFLLIDAKTRSQIEKFNLTEEDIFLPEEKLYRKLLAGHEQLTALDAKLEALEKLYKEIEEQSKGININLNGSMKAHHAKANRIADRIRQKYISHIKRSESDKLQQADKIKQTLFPSNSLQERHDNFIPYFKKYGRKFIDDLVANQSGIKSEFIILREE